MSDQVRHITIDVSVADEQIRGQVTDSAGQPMPFAGWLGLIGALDGMLGSSDQAAEAPSPPDHTPAP